jgi:hypothetical protein
MAQRGSAANPRRPRGNVPQEPAASDRAGMSWWKASLLVFLAICVAGIVPVALAGQLLGIWSITIPYGLPPLYPTPTPTPTPALAADLAVLRDTLQALV